MKMNTLRLLGITVAALISTSANAGFRIVAPTQDSHTVGKYLRLELAGCKPWWGAPNFSIQVDGQATELTWDTPLYSGRWTAALPPLFEGTHQIEVSGHCSWHRTSVQSAFHVDRLFSIEPARELARHVMGKAAPESVNWEWGEAIFLEGLLRLDTVLDRKSDYIRAYHEHWAHVGLPKVDRSDLCPSALTALGLVQKENDWVGMNSLAEVSAYLKGEPRNALGTLNHLGSSWLDAFFPKSIWVDSLMMYGVLAVRWGDYSKDHELKQFGLDQVSAFASVLQDSKTGLFRHAWLSESGSVLPESETYWLRGNSWVLASIAEMMDYADLGSPQAAEMIRIFRKLADGLIVHQQPSGLWDSIANLPGYLYTETSGSALVAYSLIKGVRYGWLPPEYLEPAEKALNAVTSRMLPENDGVSMPSISAATNAGPRWLYATVPRVKNAYYGVGMYLLAATEMAKLQSEKSSRRE